MQDDLSRQQEEGSYHIGALDIGSNSFHFVFARVVNDNIQIVHSEKYRVRLAQGLDSDNILAPEAIERGVKALADLAPLTENLTPDNFRVVATYTLRQAKNAETFLNAAAKVFPFDIEVISGHEEARLIYQGAAHYLPPDTQRLIIDIGGGSTECVIGVNFETKQLTSLNIGCVSFARLYFPDGKITQRAFNNAIMHAKQEIESHVPRFKKTGWQAVIGTSGTMKCLYNQLNQLRDDTRPFNLKELIALKKQLIVAGHADNISLTNLKETRRHILAPGLAIIIALTEMLAIDDIDYCDYSLREGVLNEQLDVIQFSDIRDRTVNSLVTRFNVEQLQVDKVTELAMQLFEAAKQPWALEKKIYKQLLVWAIQVHEIGYDINPSAHHKHSRYILQHADLAGFNLEQQLALAWMVGNQRKKVQFEEEQFWYVLNIGALSKLLAILRISVLLCQQRQLAEEAHFTANIDSESLDLSFESGWLDDRSLIQADLASEKKQQSLLGVNLTYS